MIKYNLINSAYLLLIHSKGLFLLCHLLCHQKFASLSSIWAPGELLSSINQKLMVRARNLS